MPALEEMVVGVVIDRHGEGFKVDIGSSMPASLSWLTFPLASRKNRPNLNPGAVVYGRITLASKDMEPEMACSTISGKAGGFGELKGGTVVTNCSLAYCRKLLSPSATVLRLLGQRIPYELAVGLNGRVWVNSTSNKDSILIANTIQHADGLSDQQTELLVKQMLQRHSN